MSLTKPPGPLSAQPTPEINYTLDGPKHRILFEPHPRRIRAEIGGVTALDTVRGRLLHESNIVPVLYAPVEDFDETLLERTEHVTHCPFKGEARYWSLRVDGETIPDAVWSYEDPLEGARGITGLVSFLAPGVDLELEGAGVIAGVAFR